LDYQEAQQAVEVVRAAGAPAMLGFNRRFDPNHAALREEVKSGTVGNLEIIQMTSRGPNLPPMSYLPTSGGQLRDQTVHFFDLLRWISEDEPEEVYVLGAALVDPKVAELGDIDTSIVSIRMSRGALCQIDCSRRTGYGYDERIEVFGSKGLVESRRQRARGVSRYIGDKIIEDGLHAGWFERIEQSYYLALDAFVGAITKGIPPSPSLEDGLKAQLLADKATESLKSGKPVKFTK
jgi:myo-inositol 2-dehydrogenase / D-chiro-inositol 1-dehydrogenase